MSERETGYPHAQIVRLEAELEAERARGQANLDRAAREHAQMQARLDALERKLDALAGFFPEADVIQAVYNRGAADAREMDAVPLRRDRGHLRRIVGAASAAVLLRSLFRHSGAVAAGTAGLVAAGAVTYALAPVVTSPAPAPRTLTSSATAAPSWTPVAVPASRRPSPTPMPLHRRPPGTPAAASPSPAPASTVQVTDQGPQAPGIPAASIAIPVMIPAIGHGHAPNRVRVRVGGAPPVRVILPAVPSLPSAVLPTVLPSAVLPGVLRDLREFPGDGLF